MKYIFILITMGTVLGFLIITYFSLSSLDNTGLSSEAVEGKRTWQRKACVECHTLFGR